MYHKASNENHITNSSEENILLCHGISDDSIATVTDDKVRLLVLHKIYFFNPIPTFLCYLIQYQGDKKYPCLVEIGPSPYLIDVKTDS